MKKILSRIGLFFTFAVLAFIYLPNSASLQSNEVESTQATLAAFYTNGRIAFMSGRSGPFKIYSMDPNGSNVTQLTNGSDYYPSFSRDGSRIAFTSGRDGNSEIYVMNADGTGQTRLTYNTASDLYAVFSPDGNRIAFNSDRDGNSEIYVMNSDGSGVTRLTSTVNSASDQTPSWSPDGTKLAFASNRDGNYEIYVMNANGSSPTRLTNSSIGDFSPNWTPDGSKISFESNGDLYVMNPNGTGQTRISTVVWNHEWSPDGTKISYVRDYDVYVMNADGSGSVNITNNGSGIIDYFPAWQPIPTSCTYSIDYSGWYAPKIANGTDQTVTTQSGCPWTAVSNVPWITINSGNSGTGTGVFHWTAAENTGAARTGTITAAGQTVTVHQDSGAPCSQTPISLGQTANGILSTADCMDYGAYIDEYNFSGNQGQRIAISMNSTEVDSQLKLLNSSGQEIANSNSSTSLTERSSTETNDLPLPSPAEITENLSPAAANARLPNGSGYFTLPATGTYKIRARGNTGNYTLSLASDCNAAINFGQTVTGSLSTSCVNASGQNFKSYTFSGTAGQQIAVEMNSTAFDTYLELYNGTTLVTSNDDSGNTVNSRIPANSGYFTLPATATYTIVARGYSASATGDFTLSLATQTTNPPSTAGLQYYPLAYPIRLLDTRSGQPACYAPGVGFTGYETIKTQPAQITCQGLTIPATAQAIVGTATALNTPQGGNLRLYPAGEPLAEVSNVNFIPGRTVSNSFTVKLGTGGAFNIYSYSPSDVIIDVTGYYAAPGTGGLYYHQLPNPIRILETRPGEAGYQTPGAPLSANSVRLQQAGNISYLGVSIPSTARAITGNATVVNNGFNTAGSVRLYPGDISQVPVTENINYVVNQTIPNAFTARLDSSGRFNIYTSAATHVLIDVTGYYSTEPAVDVNGSQGLLFNILPRPFRLLDTRAGFQGCDAPGAKLPAQTVRVQTVRGRTCSNQTVPANAKAIFGNATVVNNFAGASFGNIRLYPGEQPLANASNLNYVQGDVMPNSFIVGLGTTNGAMNIWSFSSTDFIVDVSGYFAAPTP